MKLVYTVVCLSYMFNTAACEVYWHNLRNKLLHKPMIKYI